MKGFLLLYLLLPVSILNAQVPTDGLIAHYPFNGNSNDETIYKNNGIVSGAVLTADRFGNANSAFYFDGDSRIFIPPDSVLDINGDISLCTWMKVDSIPHPGIILWRGNELHGLDPYGIGFWNTSISFFRDINSNKSVNISYPLATPTQSGFHFVAGTFNSNTGHMKLYFDSILVITKYTPDLCEYETSEYYNMIGNVDTLHQNLGFIGIIDDVKIYNRVLSEQEILTLYRESSIVAYSDYNTTDAIKIYPNPTSDYIIVESLSGKKIQGKIYTLTGNIVYEFRSNGQKKIKLRDFAIGSYIIKINCNNRIFSDKLVITK